METNLPERLEQANPTLHAIEMIANALGLKMFKLWDKVRDSK